MVLIGYIRHFESDRALDDERWPGFHFHKHLPNILPADSEGEEKQSIREEQNADDQS
jgi:hypothetical protein